MRKNKVYSGIKKSKQYKPIWYIFYTFSLLKYTYKQVTNKPEKRNDTANLIEFLFCRPTNESKSQRTFGTFASSDTQANASAYKRAKFFPALIDKDYFCIMTDVHNTKTRSYNMSQIKGKDTKPENLVRKHLFSKGFRYRLHSKDLPGKPDIVLPKYKTVIFVNGCFWHGHENCKKFVIPKIRTDWWLEKINRNKTNDKKNNELLTSIGWNVITIFECQLDKQKINNTLSSLIQQIKQDTDR